MPEEQGSNNMMAEVNSFNMGSEGNSQRSPINGRGSSFQYRGAYMNLHRAMNIYDPGSSMLRRNNMTSLESSQSPLDGSSIHASTQRGSQNMLASRSALENTESDFRTITMKESGILANENYLHTDQGNTES